MALGRSSHQSASRLLRHLPPPSKQPGDKLVPVSNTLRLAKMMPDARVVVMKRSGHCPQEEVPEGFAQVVNGFLESALAAPHARVAAA
jgi:hypothetical protein